MVEKVLATDDLKVRWGSLRVAISPEGSDIIADGA
jgi:hypothetical protein